MTPNLQKSTGLPLHTHPLLSVQNSPRCVFIDASGLLYRSFYAIRSLHSSTGEPTAALYGFIRSILKTVQDLQPSYIVTVFDGKNNKRSRLEIYPEYKAHRKPTPVELIHQIQEAKRFCTLAHLPLLDIEGVEADDVIASLVTGAKRHFQDNNKISATIIILSADKDLMQLVEEHHVYIVNPMKENQLIDHATVVNEWNITPNQIKDYLAIVGDSSDNVPGVPGLGPKAAQQLIAEWSSIENIYANLEKIIEKTRTKLIAGQALAELSLQLVALHENVSLPPFSEFFVSSFSYTLSPSHNLIDFYKEKGFYSLLSKDKSSLLPKKENSSKRFVQPSLFQETLSLPTEPLCESQSVAFACTTIIVDSETQLIAFYTWLRQQTLLAIDCETTSLNPHIAKLVGLGCGSGPDLVYYIDFAHGSLSADTVIPSLRDIILEHDIGIIGHNCKYDFHVLIQYKFQIPPKVRFDTLVSSWIMAAHERTHNLDALSLRYFAKHKIPIEELIGKAGRGKAQISMQDVPQELISKYCAEDVEYTLRLYTLFQEKLSNFSDIQNIFYNIEMPLVPILITMEQEGIYLNESTLSSLKSEVEKLIDISKRAIFTLAGAEFNINSPKQLCDILYNKLMLPPIKKGKTAFSTDAEVLEELAIEWPIAQSILEYRQLEKLRSTYIEALPKAINPKTGRIHCTFVQSGTATGRLSCQDPNLQNIPVRTELGRSIRSAFQPQHPNWSYLSCDYSQIELRILAHMSEDPLLLYAFDHDLDIHAQTASEIFHVDIKNVTSEMRQKAKAVNFGVIYGQSGFGLSKELHIPAKEAHHFIHAYFTRYSQVERTIQAAKEEARHCGYASTLTGRRRLLPDINSSNHTVRSFQERLAINTPFQGTAADIIKIAMIAVHKVLIKKSFKAKMLLQIHDELLFELPDEEIEEVSSIVKYEMEHVMSLKIPLKVDIAIGKNWKEC